MILGCETNKCHITPCHDSACGVIVSLLKVGIIIHSLASLAV